MSIKIDVSVGEIMDKLTILDIKADKIDDTEKLANILKERESLLPAIALPAYQTDEIQQLAAKLKQVNLRLWEIEDAIRLKEAEKCFDEEFIELARSVYFTNDQRASLKKQINLKTGSELVEEKSYKTINKQTVINDKTEQELKQMRICMIGVGLMGHGIAKNILRAGPYHLSFLHHDGNQPIDDLLAAGAVQSETLSMICPNADIILLCVTGAQSRNSVVFRARCFCKRSTRSDRAGLFNQLT